MNSGKIRASTICVIRGNGTILAVPGYVPVKGLFYRPLGGEINFGEHSRDAIARELREEIQADITGLRCLGLIENFYTRYDVPQHELVVVYEAELVDRSLYQMTSIRGQEEDEVFEVYWVPLAEFMAGRATLFPDGLLSMLL